LLFHRSVTFQVIGAWTLIIKAFVIETLRQRARR
jgi:hypothetical protein